MYLHNASSAPLVRPASRRAACPRGGFTLVELLVVITIIGLLMAMMTSAVFDAYRAVQRSRHVSEISKLSQGMESYKEKFGAYPPDGTGGEQIMKQHVRTAFPSWRGRGTSRPPADLNPAKAVVFWLSRISTDPTDPFRQTTGSMSGTKAGKEDDRVNLMTFNNQQVKNGMYFPPDYDVDNDPPFVYFNSETYPRAVYKFERQEVSSIRPYDRGQRTDGSSSGTGSQGGSNRDYCAPDTFQIISAGLDKRLGRGGTIYVDTVNAGGGSQSITEDDEDNHVNFDNRMIKDVK
jgi:prepilin-type N-terminal cleavage/methylation domain-containing protein